jgi:hypothetical protein
VALQEEKGKIKTREGEEIEEKGEMNENRKKKEQHNFALSTNDIVGLSLVLGAQFLNTVCVMK